MSERNKLYNFFESNKKPELQRPTLRIFGEETKRFRELQFTTRANHIIDKLEAYGEGQQLPFQGYFSTNEGSNIVNIQADGAMHFDFSDMPYKGYLAQLAAEPDYEVDTTDVVSLKKLTENDTISQILQLPSPHLVIELRTITNPDIVEAIKSLFMHDEIDPFHLEGISTKYHLLNRDRISKTLHIQTQDFGTVSKELENNNRHGIVDASNPEVTPIVGFSLPLHDADLPLLTTAIETLESQVQKFLGI